MTTTTVTPAAAGPAPVGLARPKAQRGHHAGGSGGERQHGARAVLTAPDAWPLLSTSIIARLPLAMLSLGFTPRCRSGGQHAPGRVMRPAPDVVDGVLVAKAPAGLELIGGRG